MNEVKKTAEVPKDTEAKLKEAVELLEDAEMFVPDRLRAHRQFLKRTRAFLEGVKK